MLVAFGFLAILIGILIAVGLSEIFLKIYIGLIFLLVGIFLLRRPKKRNRFSWKKLIAIGSAAAFNKGITGGGFGPVLTGGQIMSGIENKTAVGITSMVEGIVSLVGVIFYLIITGFTYLNMPLTLSLLIGGLFATPLAAYAVNKIHPRKLRSLMGLVSIILGLIVILKIFIG